MMEIERKVLGIDKKKLLVEIKNLRPAAKKLFEGLVRIRYFDFSDGSIKARKDLLRVRELREKGKPSRTELVYKIYKGVKDGCKCFEEIEVEQEGRGWFEKYSKFLLALGFVQTMYYEKKRTHFAYKKVKFEIDEHPRVPVFIEIEAGSAREIDAAIKLLRLEGYEQTAETISELLVRKYKGLKLNELIF